MENNELPDIDGARRYALETLDHKLPAGLYYHALIHTRDEVEPAALRLAEMEGVNREDILLIRTAALFHDVGYVEGSKDHETTSQRIAGEVLPRFRYNPDQIQKIQGMIEATRVPQNPKNLLEKIVVDADLDILGQENFLARCLDLRAEIEARGSPIGLEQWYRKQLRFLRSHRYFTKSAQAVRDPIKKKNIELLSQAIRECQLP